jgi:aminomethyltransferase
MVEFAGWEMPVQYAGILKEHEAVRTRVGLFDVSHMGEVVFRGPRALEALGRAFTNDLSKVQDGQAQYGCLCREDGGIVDDVVVYRRSRDDLLVCVNAANRAKDFEWLAAYAGGADVRNESDEWGQLALQGPLAARVLQRLTGVDLAVIRTYRFTMGEVSGVLHRRPHGLPPADSSKSLRRGTLWDALSDAGRGEQLEPCGLGARDSCAGIIPSLRLRHGHSSTPLDGLAWV